MNVVGGIIEAFASGVDSQKAETKKLQAQLDECRKHLANSVLKECKCELASVTNVGMAKRNVKLKAQLDEANKLLIHYNNYLKSENGIANKIGTTIDDYLAKYKKNS